LRPPSITDSQKRDNQKTARANKGWTLFSPVATVCFVRIAAEITTTEKRMSTMEKLVLIMEKVLRRKLVLLSLVSLLLLLCSECNCASSFSIFGDGEEGPGENAAEEVVNVDVIIRMVCDCIVLYCIV